MKIPVTAFVALFLLSMPPSLLHAEESADSASIVSKINASGNIRIEQPAAMNARLMRPQADTTEDVRTVTPVKTPSDTRAGYRIQVFDDNNPRKAHREALAQKDRMTAAFPDYRTYVVFNSPYWRVKVGDFRSRAEAEAAKNEIIHAFPSIAAYVRIVRDRINVFD